MERKKSGIFVKAVACLLAAVLLMPVGAQAAMPETAVPMASLYLYDYSAYMVALGECEMQIHFTAQSLIVLAEIGVLVIDIYESQDNEDWDWVRTFECTDFDDESMLTGNLRRFSSHIDYSEGVSDYYYKAYVQFWGGDGTDGESYDYWTEAVLCT